MKAARPGHAPGYRLRCYPSAGFPKFTDGLKSNPQAQRLAAQALTEGYHTVEILRDLTRKQRAQGMDRQILETLR